MNEVKKNVKKGFTLVELIVVMAIFGVLMAAVMVITDPISRMFKNTSLSEKTYSYSHNIQMYLQGALEYSDNLYVYTSDKIDGNAVIGDSDGKVSDAELAKLAEQFRSDHYKDIITYDGTLGNPDHPAKGNIYIIRLVNNTNSTTIPQGQITKRTYNFQSNQSITATNPTLPTEELQLNTAYFNASDANYSFSYALGASEMILVDELATSKDTYKALKTDYNNENHNIDPMHFYLSIVLDKKASKQGYVDKNITGTTDTYRAFKCPVAVQIATLPLTNINMRTQLSGLNSAPGVQRYLKSGGTYQLQTDAQAGQGFFDDVNDKIDFSNDIYLVYAYADEIK